MSQRRGAFTDFLEGEAAPTVTTSGGSGRRGVFSDFLDGMPEAPQPEAAPQQPEAIQQPAPAPVAPQPSLAQVQAQNRARTDGGVQMPQRLDQQAPQTRVLQKPAWQTYQSPQAPVVPPDSRPITTATMAPKPEVVDPDAFLGRGGYQAPAGLQAPQGQDPIAFYEAMYAQAQPRAQSQYPAPQSPFAPSLDQQRQQAMQLDSTIPAALGVTPEELLAYDRAFGNLVDSQSPAQKAIEIAKIKRNGGLLRDQALGPRSQEEIALREKAATPGMFMAPYAAERAVESIEQGQEERFRAIDDEVDRELLGRDLQREVLEMYSKPNAGESVEQHAQRVIKEEGIDADTLSRMVKIYREQQRQAAVDDRQRQEQFERDVKQVDAEIAAKQDEEAGLLQKFSQTPDMGTVKDLLDGGRKQGDKGEVTKWDKMKAERLRELGHDVSPEDTRAPKWRNVAGEGLMGLTRGGARQVGSLPGNLGALYQSAGEDPDIQASYAGAKKPLEGLNANNVAAIFGEQVPELSKAIIAGRFGGYPAAYATVAASEGSQHYDMAYQSMLREGVNPQDAKTIAASEAVVYGAVAGALELYGLGKIVDAVQVKGLIRNRLLALAKAPAAEGATEFSQSVAQEIAGLVSGRVEGGDEQARQALENALNEGIAGALVGGGAAAPGTVGGIISDRRLENQSHQGTLKADVRPDEQVAGDGQPVRPGPADSGVPGDEPAVVGVQEPVDVADRDRGVDDGGDDGGRVPAGGQSVPAVGGQDGQLAGPDAAGQPDRTGDLDREVEDGRQTADTTRPADAAQGVGADDVGRPGRVGTGVRKVSQDRAAMEAAKRFTEAAKKAGASDRVDYAAVEAADRVERGVQDFARKLGTNLVYVEDQADTGFAVNGTIDPVNPRVVIAAAGQPGRAALGTAIHETLHSIEKTSPQAWQSLKDALATGSPHLLKMAGVSYSDRAARKGVKVKPENMPSEEVAELATAMILDTTPGRNIFGLETRAELLKTIKRGGPSLIQSTLDVFDAAVEALRPLLRKLGLVGGGKRRSRRDRRNIDAQFAAAVLSFRDALQDLSNDPNIIDEGRLILDRAEREIGVGLPQDEREAPDTTDQQEPPTDAQPEPEPDQGPDADAAQQLDDGAAEPAQPVSEMSYEEWLDGADIEVVGIGNYEVEHLNKSFEGPDAVEQAEAWAASRGLEKNQYVVQQRIRASTGEVLGAMLQLNPRGGDLVAQSAMGIKDRYEQAVRKSAPTPATTAVAEKPAPKKKKTKRVKPVKPKTSDSKPDEAPLPKEGEKSNKTAPIPSEKEGVISDGTIGRGLTGEVDGVPKNHVMFKPVKGKNGASIVGYYWASTIEEGMYRDRKVSDWSESGTSTGTGRAIVHHYYVQHPNGKITIEGVGSAQKILGISETRLQTIARREQARRKYEEENQKKILARLEKSASDTLAEANRKYRMANSGGMITPEQSDAQFQRAKPLTKDGKFVRAAGDNAVLLQDNGWTIVTPQPAPAKAGQAEGQKPPVSKKTAKKKRAKKKLTKSQRTKLAKGYTVGTTKKAVADMDKARPTLKSHAEDMIASRPDTGEMNMVSEGVAVTPDAVEGLTRKQKAAITNAGIAVNEDDGLVLVELIGQGAVDRMVAEALMTAEERRLETAEQMATGMVELIGTVDPSDMIRGFLYPYIMAPKTISMEVVQVADLMPTAKLKMQGEKFEVKYQAGQMMLVGDKYTFPLEGLETIPADEGTVNLPKDDGAAPFSIAAWHGGPYDFDRFDISKIGTGEGAQVYGYGLYFAGKEAVADYYRQNVKDIRRLDAINKKLSELSRIMDADSGPGYRNFKSEKGARASEEYDRLMSEKLNMKGRKYKVTLAPNEDELLDWDKPLSEQSEKVRKALAGSGVGPIQTDADVRAYGYVIEPQQLELSDTTVYKIRRPDGRSVPAVLGGGRLFQSKQEAIDNLNSVISQKDGDSVYRHLSQREGGDRAASALLRSLGIRGIRYLDGSSRNRANVRSGIDSAHLAAAKSFKENGDTATDAMIGMKKAYPDAPNQALQDAVDEAYGIDRGSYNYVIFDDADVTIDAKFSLYDSGRLPFDDFTVTGLNGKVSGDLFAEQKKNDKKYKAISAIPEDQQVLAGKLNLTVSDYQLANTLTEDDLNPGIVLGVKQYLLGGEKPEPVLGVEIKDVRDGFNAARDNASQAQRDNRRKTDEPDKDQTSLFSLASDPKEVSIFEDLTKLIHADQYAEARVVAYPDGTMYAIRTGDGIHQNVRKWVEANVDKPPQGQPAHLYFTARTLNEKDGGPYHVYATDPGEQAKLSPEAKRVLRRLGFKSFRGEKPVGFPVKPLAVSKKEVAAPSAFAPFSIAPSTDSKAFKDWFGDSVVTVDGKPGSKPLVVYHGSRTKVPTIIKTPFFYLTQSRSEARSYSGENVSPRTGERMGVNVGKSGEVSAYYVSIQNPVYLPQHNKYFLESPDYMRRQIAEWVEQGYDGVVMPWEGNDGLDGPLNYIAFRPEQIKSATANVGTYDPNNPDIRFSVAAWHGSPHDFDRFDISKIGTGEGAQAYGHGLYFAGKEDVADWYRDKLSQRQGPPPRFYHPDTDIQTVLDNHAPSLWSGDDRTMRRVTVDALDDSIQRMRGGIEQHEDMIALFDNDAKKPPQYQDYKKDLKKYRKTLETLENAKKEVGTARISRALKYRIRSKELGSDGAYTYREIDDTYKYGWLHAQIGNVLSDIKNGVSWDDAVTSSVADLEARRDHHKVYGHDSKEYAPETIQQAIDELKALTPGMVTQVKAGRKYKVTLAPDEDELLDWDKPLSEQSEKVRKAVEALRSGFMAARDMKQAGASLYRAISRQVGRDELASARLKMEGIRGIRYLDGSSRNKSAHYKATFSKPIPESAIPRGSDQSTAQWTARNIIEIAAGDNNGDPAKTAKQIRDEAKSMEANAFYDTAGSAKLYRAVADMLDAGEITLKDARDYNYVIFDDADVTIDAKFSVAYSDIGHDGNSDLWWFSPEGLTAMKPPKISAEKAFGGSRADMVDSVHEDIPEAEEGIIRGRIDHDKKVISLMPGLDPDRWNYRQVDKAVTAAYRQFDALYPDYRVVEFDMDNALPFSIQDDPNDDLSKPLADANDSSAIDEAAKRMNMLLGMGEDKANAAIAGLGRAVVKGVYRGTRLNELVEWFAGTAPGEVLNAARIKAIEQFAPRSLLDPELAQAVQDVSIGQTYGNRIGKEVARLMTGGGTSKQMGLTVPKELATPETDKLLGRYMRGESQLEDLPAELRPFGERVREIVTQLGRDAVQVGLLDQETFEKNEWTYLPRLYYKREMEQSGIRGISRNLRMVRDRFKFRSSDAYWIADRQGNPVKAGRKTPRFDSADERDQHLERLIRQEVLKILNRGNRDKPFVAADLNRGKLRAMPDKDRLAIEQIKLDVSMRYSKRDPLDDKALDRMGLIRQGSYPAAKAIMQINHDVFVARLMNRVAQTVSWVSDTELTGYKEIPNSPAYGAMAGKFAPTPLADEIIGLRDRDGVYQIYEEVIRMWKKGKALALDTPIPTVDGWKTMGDIEVGDIVFDESGKPCHVTFTTPIQYNRDCYRVKFSDGTEIVADAEHLWYTDTPNKARCGVKNTLEILDTLHYGKKTKCNTHSIPVAGPIVTPEAELPIDPYVLGVWLGDGYSRTGQFCASKEDADEMVRLVERADHITCGPPQQDKRSGVKTFAIFDDRVEAPQRKHGKFAVAERTRVYSIAPLLNSLGIRGPKKKHIPAQYLRASIDQRMALLRGMMDTDGTVEKSACSYCTILPDLKDDFVELVRSLGYKPTSRKKGGAYTIQFSAFSDRPVFDLSRKRYKMAPPIEGRRARSNTRQIVDVERVDSVPVRCIQVSSPSSLYLAGEAMVPTHNTVYNPATHGRNLLGNIIFAELAGNSPINPTNWKYYKRGVLLLMGKGDAKQLDLAWKLGVPGGDIARQELQNALQAINPTMNPEHTPSALSAIGAGVTKYLRAADEAAVELYSAEDDFYKIAAWLKYMDMGMSPEAAAREVRTWFPYYDQIPKTLAIKSARFVMPFYSFFHESLRIAGNAARRRPFTFARVLSYPVAISQLSLLALGLGDDDWESVQKDMRGQVGGYPVFSAILPVRDEDGRLIQWDMTYTIPYAGILGKRVERHDRETETYRDILKWLFLGNPLINTGVGLALDQDLYFGRPLKQTGMSDAEALKARADFVAKQALPPLTPSIGGYAGIPEVLGGGTTYEALTDEHVSTSTLGKRNEWQQTLRSITGIDVRYAGPQLWRLIDDYIAENDYAPQPAWSGDSTPASRARAELYQAVLSGDQEAFNRAIKSLSENEKPVTRRKDIDRLINDRHPLRRLKKDDYDTFLSSLSGEDRRVADEVLGEYERVKVRAREMYERMPAEK